MLEPGRVGLEPGQVAAKLGGRVLDAERDLVEGRGDVGQLGRERGDARDLLGGARGELAGALAVGGAQELGGRTRGRRQLVEVAQPLALGPQRVGLAGGGCELVDPRDEILEVEPAPGGVGGLAARRLEGGRRQREGRATHPPSRPPARPCRRARRAARAAAPGARAGAPRAGTTSR